MARNYLLKLTLSDFWDSRIIKSEDSEGQEEEGIFIPFNKNGIKPFGKRNVVCAYAFVTEKFNATTSDYTYYVKQKTNKDHVAYLDSIGRTTPYIGEMKESSYAPKKQNFNSGSIVKKIK